MASVAPRYAAALIDVLTDPKQGHDANAVLASLDLFRQGLHESDELRRALLTPAITDAHKKSVVSKLAGLFGLAPIAVNFLDVVISHHRIGQLDEILQDARLELDGRQGLARATVTSAVALSDSEKEDLLLHLAKLTGQAVVGEYAVDATLLGGVSVKIGSKVYDGSLRGQLEGLRKQLSGQVR